MNKWWELTDKAEHLFEVITIVFKNARTSKIVFWCGLLRDTVQTSVRLMENKLNGGLERWASA